ncbi:hypothetical protein PS9374_04494 [Planomonospora sphaerica]|uniref:Uncharacterized protein n=1 Tax=Planomonospora sphaerica TaxID=161355 RepID=A0A171DIY5_9ACTN|nr:hypothetical protein [Planomonospora sphaerica]GAT68829.1 hypothetical protein PS9374_04494 [Planomonospora sphaerica]
MLTAVRHDTQTVLAQRQVTATSNEIGAFTPLLAGLEFIELGQTNGLDALTAEAFTRWWQSADGPHRHAMIVLLLDQVRIAPALGGRLAPVDVSRVTFTWR